jgi:glycosyltransferase involved in cell wall biosynthesis
MQGLKYISWADTTGYAIAAKSYIRALIDTGVVLTWTPMMPGKYSYEAQAATTWPCPKLTTVCNRSIDYDTVLIHTVPEYYPEFIEQERLDGRRIFGYTVWELDRLPSHWPEVLNRLDGVIVPCGWNADVFRNSGVKVPIHVVPHLSQFAEIPTLNNVAREALQARLGHKSLLRDRFIFYTIGYWSNRKAPYLALEAYWQAFDAGDPVLMIVKTSTHDITSWHRHWRNGFHRQHPSPERTVARLAAKYSRPAPFLIIPDESLSDEEMFALHDMGDCFISLARTEGWGLGAFEAARLGKPVVMTGYGGQLEYLSPEYAWLVNYDMVPVYEPTWSSSYKPGDYWSEPSVSHAASQLRNIYTNQSAAKERALHLADKIACDFSVTTTIKALLKALK